MTMASKTQCLTLSSYSSYCRLRTGWKTWGGSSVAGFLSSSVVKVKRNITFTFWNHEWTWGRHGVEVNPGFDSTVSLMPLETVEFACPPRVCVGFLQVLQFPVTVMLLYSTCWNEWHCDRRPLQGASPPPPLTQTAKTKARESDWVTGDGWLSRSAAWLSVWCYWNSKK